MEKASGVYLTLTDNSFQTSGTSSLVPLIPMLTTKGDTGSLNVVTADTFESVVGYDLTYNTNYYGLKTILENVTKAKVWRLNQNAKMANAYFASTSSTKSSDDDCEAFEEITELDPKPVLAVAHKYVGNWQTTAIKFTPTATEYTQANENPNETITQTIEYDSVSSTETSVIGSDVIKGGCIFYNSSDNAIVGVIKSDGNVYKVSSNEVTSNVCGTATWDGEKLTIELTASLSKDNFWYVHVIPAEITDWTLSVAKYEDGTYTVQKTYDFSTDTTSDVYWEDVDFGDVTLFINGTLSSNWSAIRAYFTLDNGSNGDSTVDPYEIDTSLIKTSGCNVLLTNGLTDYRIANALISACETAKCHIFQDAPAYSQYIDLEEWMSHVSNSEYLAVGARPDVAETSDGTQFYIYPSVNYAYIFGNMLTSQGNLCYPPAGRSYGTIVASDLMECDYENYANELKTNRINWQRLDDSVSVMWEQRTTYSLDTDLSYIAPVFIVDDLTSQLVSYEKNFNFRYMTTTDLENQTSGMKSILDDFVDNNLLYSYTLKVPSYEEAQESGRTLSILIAVVVMKDSEVINIELVLENAS